MTTVKAVSMPGTILVVGTSEFHCCVVPGGWLISEWEDGVHVVTQRLPAAVVQFLGSPDATANLAAMAKDFARSVEDAHARIQAAHPPASTMDPPGPGDSGE
jgi:hypothetical protein